jgi:hypothetical protein
MGVGISIFLFAVGAILAWGVNTNTTGGVNVDTIGAILMIVGAVGFLLSLAFWSTLGFGGRRDTYVERDVSDHHHHRAA